VNGRLIAEVNLGKVITAIAVLQLPLSEVDRFAIFGTSDGSIYIVSPKIAVGKTVVRQLPSEHKAAIQSFTVHPDRRSFISKDEDRITYIWTGLGLNSMMLKIESYLGCAICGGKHTVRCPVCARAVCQQCALCGTCNFCNAWEMFVCPVDVRK
jgi:hypothetical protein